MPIVNVTQIHIPPELPDEARRMVEDVNDLLRKVTEEISDLHANPKLYTLEQRRDIAERCEIALAIQRDARTATSVRIRVAGRDRGMRKYFWNSPAFRYIHFTG